VETRLDVAQLTRLRMVLGRLGRVLRQQTADGLSYPQISLLFSIERSSPVTAGELAVSEGVTPPSVTRSLNELDRRGLIWRGHHTIDRRVTLIYLTDSGKRECTRLRRSRDAWLAEHLTRLAPEEIHVLIAALPVLERLCDPALPNSAGDPAIPGATG
jgi:DNA-binding MarR family transcriptional regulator